MTSKLFTRKRAACLCSSCTRFSILRRILLAARRIFLRFLDGDFAARLSSSSSLSQSLCILKNEPSPIFPTESAQYQVRNERTPGSRATTRAWFSRLGGSFSS